MVVINAFSAWRESSRVCWTTIGTSDTISEAKSVFRGSRFDDIEEDIRALRKDRTRKKTTAVVLLIAALGAALFVTTLMYRDTLSERSGGQDRC